MVVTVLRMGSDSFHHFSCQSELRGGTSRMTSEFKGFRNHLELVISPGTTKQYLKLITFSLEIFNSAPGQGLAGTLSCVFAFFDLYDLCDFFLTTVCGTNRGLELQAPGSAI